MKTSILHISDLHLSDSNFHNIKSKISPMINRISTEVSNVENVIAIFSGDITNKGTEEEWTLAKELIKYFIFEFTKVHNSIKLQLFFSPGNHDLYHNEKSKVERSKILNTIINEKGLLKLNNETIGICCSPFERFYDFSKQYEEYDVKYSDKLLFNSIINTNNFFINIKILNSAWLSEIKESVSQIIYPPELLENFSKNIDNSFNITVCHHPLNWLNPKNTMKRSIENTILANSDLLLVGHEHYNETEKQSRGNNPMCLVSKAGKFSGDNGSCFHLITFNNEQEEITDLGFILKEGVFTPEEPIKQKVKIRKVQCLTDEFQDFVSSSDIKISFNNREDLKLDDIYIEPVLEDITEIHEIPLNTNLSNILRNQKNKFILISGDDLSGKTSILKRAFTSLSNSKVPLFVTANDFDTKNVNKVIRSKLKKQYRNINFDYYFSLPIEKRVLIIDDWDLSPNDNTTDSSIINELKKLFSFIIISISDITKYRYTSHYKEFFQRDTDLFEIRPFGHELKEKLFHKWLSFRTDSEEESNDTLLKLKDLHRQITDITLNKVMPSYPFFLLLFLNVSSSNIPQKYDFTQYGECYQASIMKSLFNVVKEDYGSYLDVLTYFAYNCYKIKQKYVTQESFDIFLDTYIENFVFTDRLNREKIKKVLLESRLLRKNEENKIGFTHKYVYCFEIARYLSLTAEEKETVQTIEHLTKTLFDNDSANIVIFLTHFIPQGKFWSKLIDNIGAIFVEQDIDTLDMKNSEEYVNAFEKVGTQLIIKKKDMLQERIERAKLLDEMEYDRTKHMKQENDCNRSSSEVSIERGLSIINKIVEHIKYMEITGQILYNRKNRIKEDILVEFLTKNIEASLRVINFMNVSADQAVDDAKKYILKEILTEDPKAIPSDNQLKELAKKFLFFLCYRNTDAILFKTALTIGNDSIIRIFKKIYISDKTPAKGLIYFIVKLEYSTDFPFDELKEFKNIHKKNIVVRLMIRHIVARYVYMNEVKHYLLQKINKEFKIDTKYEHSEEKRRFLNG